MKRRNETVETVLCERVLSAEEVAYISVQIQQELEAYIDPVKREYLPRFFKTGKGSMARGISFWEWWYPTPGRWQSSTSTNQGNGNPCFSEWHECRLCAPC